MALTSCSRSWRSAVANDEHTVDSRIKTRGLTIALTDSVDGKLQVQKKASDLEALWGDYPLDVEHCACGVRAFRKEVVGAPLTSSWVWRASWLPRVSTQLSSRECRPILRLMARSKTLRPCRTEHKVLQTGDVS
jgi:hypothetical protein